MNISLWFRSLVFAWRVCFQSGNRAYGTTAKVERVFSVEYVAGLDCVMGGVAGVDGTVAIY